MSKSSVIILLLVHFVLIRKSLQQFNVDMNIDSIEEKIQQSFHRALNADTNINSLEDNEVAENIGTCRCVAKCEKCLDNAFIQMTNDELCDSSKEEMLCCEENLSLNPMRINPPKNTTVVRSCGYRVANTAASYTDYDEYNSAPWMVALTVDPKVGTIAGAGAHGFCGGSLIHPRVVLTAAHCLDDIQNYMILIHAGEWNSKYDQNSRQTRKVLSRSVHPDYISKLRWNDLALLFLDTNFDINMNVGIACLASFENLKHVDYDHCVLYGWGKISKENRNHPDVVKEILLKLDTNKQKCLNDLIKTFNNEATNISFVCGYINLDNKELSNDDVFCDNDNGGPLVCPLNGDYIQFGIASWQYNCDNTNLPALFTEIGPAIQWIQEETHLHKLELESIVS